MTTTAHCPPKRFWSTYAQRCRSNTRLPRLSANGFGWTFHRQANLLWPKCFGHSAFIGISAATSGSIRAAASIRLARIPPTRAASIVVSSPLTFSPPDRIQHEHHISFPRSGIAGVAIQLCRQSPRIQGDRLARMSHPAESPTLRHPRQGRRLLALAHRHPSPLQPRLRMSGRAPVEHAQEGQRPSARFHRHDGHHSSPSPRGVPAGHRHRRLCRRCHSQPPQRRKHPLRGRHQSDPRFNPRRSAFETGIARPCHRRQRQFHIAPGAGFFLCLTH
jgi:hypothetical protein